MADVNKSFGVGRLSRDRGDIPNSVQVAGDRSTSSEFSFGSK